jgi:hypothetical protein
MEPLRIVKQAGDEHMNKLYAGQADSLQHLALLGLLGGGGLAGLRWLYHAATEEPEGELSNTPATVQMTITDPTRLAKSAGALTEGLKVLDKAVTGIPGMDYGMFTPSSPSELRSAIPLSVLVGLGGLYGGYSLVDSLRRGRTEQRLDQDEEKARADFERALQEQFEESGRLKQAMCSVEEEEVEKSAYVNEALGLGTGVAALIWYLSHKATLDRMRRMDVEDEQLSLLKKRQREQAAKQPIPLSVEISTPGVGDEETALERLLQKRKALPFAARQG